MIGRIAEIIGRVPRRTASWISAEGRRRRREERLFERLFRSLMNDRHSRERVDRILAVQDDDPRFDGIVVEEERGLPGSPRHRSSGWWVQMLTRYALAQHHSPGALVLDSCSGLGWGSYLVEAVARRVVAVELDPAVIRLARELWPTTRTTHVQGSALDLALADGSVDVALAMESIEHFSRGDIRRYLDELARVLKPGGVVIGSSAFPETESDAEALCARNPWHLHICTRTEMEGLLEERFPSWNVAANRLFFWASR